MQAPDTVQIKTIVRDAISHGTMQKLANRLGNSHSEISRQYDPNNEKRTAIAEAARHFWALAEEDPEGYQVIKTYFVMLLESWAEPVPTSDKALSGLVGDAAEKLNELQKARFIDGSSDKVQREATLHTIMALQQFLAGLGKQLALKSEKSEADRFNKRAG